MSVTWTYCLQDWRRMLLRALGQTVGHFRGCKAGSILRRMQEVQFLPRSVGDPVDKYTLSLFS